MLPNVPSAGFAKAQDIIAGSSLSVTITSNEQDVLLPEPSTTVQTTIVVPRLKVTLSRELPLPAVAPVKT